MKSCSDTLAAKLCAMCKRNLVAILGYSDRMCVCVGITWNRIDNSLDGLPVSIARDCLTELVHQGVEEPHLDAQIAAGC